jgi:hypothetical protein
MAYGNPDRTVFLRIRRWVDNDLAAQRRPVSVFGPLILAIFALGGAHALGSAAVTVGWMVIAPLGLVWTTFLLWRAARLYRAVAIKGDRAFDQTGKYQLSPEYHRSESVTATAQRKRSVRQRSRA